LAKLVCKKLELGVSAVVESSEEAELMSKTSDARIQEMAQTSLSEYKRMAQESQNTIVSLKKEIQDLKGLMEQFLGEKSQIELQ
jgi:regulator of sirC expression with transglutaminase-like and TPR domain